MTSKNRRKVVAVVVAFLVSSSSISLYFSPCFSLFPAVSWHLGSPKQPTKSGYRHIYIYICCRLQKLGPIFRFIGAETGPKFEAEIDNENNKKKFPPRCWVPTLCITRCDFAFCARTVRGFNNGAFMLYNIPAPVLNPCPAPFSNARFPAPKVPFRKTSPSAQTPIFKAPKPFWRGWTGTAQKPPCVYFEAQARPPENPKA